MVRGARRVAIIAIVVSLVVAAVLGIVALLTGGFGETQSKILLTTLAVSGFGSTALCHLAIVTRDIRAVGFVGIAASAAAAGCAFTLIWWDWGEPVPDAWFKAFGVLGILAVSMAQVNLLLLLAGRRHPALRSALIGTLIAIAAVTILLWLPILTDGDIPGEHGDVYWRWFGVVAILDALGTIAVPILGLVLRRPEGAVSGTRLILELSPDLSERLAVAAGREGVSHEDAALAVLDRALPRES